MTNLFATSDIASRDIISTHSFELPSSQEELCEPHLLHVSQTRPILAITTFPRDYAKSCDISTFIRLFPEARHNRETLCRAILSRRLDKRVSEAGHGQRASVALVVQTQRSLPRHHVY
jgi:hypothetical protein